MVREVEDLRNLKIGILAGGTSSERDISLKSGKAVFRSLEENGLKVKMVDIKEGSPSWLEDLDIDAAFMTTMVLR